jgi:WD40 repeat protein
MLRWLLTSGLIAVLAAGGFYLLVGAPKPYEAHTSSPTDAPKPGARAKPAAKGEVHAAEAPAAAANAPPDRREPLPSVPVGALPLVVIPEGRVNAIDKQEVPAQHEGQVLFIGTEITEEEAKRLPPDLVIRARVGSLWMQLAPGEKEKNHVPDSDILRRKVPAAHRDRDSNPAAPRATEEREYRRLGNDEEIVVNEYDTDPYRFQLWRELKVFRRLQEGDRVEEGQLLGIINPALATDDLAIKMAKLRASYADLETSQKTRDEAEQRYRTSSKLFFQGKGIESEENMRGAELTWNRYIYEAISKRQGINVAASELKQAQTTLEMHTLRSKIPGRIKTIYKNKGEWVRSTEPNVMQIFNPNKLRIEGLVEMQYVGLIREGQEVVVEPTRFVRHDKLLRGHLQDITSVSVSSKNDIVSASEDHTVRVWDRSGTQKRVLHHPAAVHAVACTPPGSAANLCLTAGSDGVARLFDLDADAAAPVYELRGGHAGSINCVAFGPQGKWCATGGDDRAICLWDTASGKQIQRFAGGQKNLSAEAASAAGGHRGAVTSLAFLSDSRLVSAGTDKTLLVWALKEDGSKDGPPLVFDRRSGDVASLGVNQREQTILFDYGRELRVLTVPDQKTIGVLQTPSGAMNFSTMAQFSPDGKLILTAGSSDGRLQLWRAPNDKRRAYELCQLISPSPTTCGAFAPDGSFLVTGTRDRQVLIWKALSQDEMKELTATVKFVEKALDSNSRQVRIWADLKEPQGLVPGATATLVVYP